MRKALSVALSCWVLVACSAGPPENGPVQTPDAEPTTRVSFEQGEQEIQVLINGKPSTTFHYAEQWDKPFLYPIRTASGTVISRGYPIDPREGEHQDHDWHRGIWYGHGDVSGHDFWRELGRDRTGTIVPASEPTFEGSGGQGTLTAELALQTEKREIIGTLQERFTFSADGSNRIIDAAITIRADKGRDLTFGDTDDGGFAFRLADEFRQDQGANLINSEGLRDTENIWGKPAKWIDYSATLEGKPVGVAMFDHPSNLRHPTRWHARGYSLSSANPFASKSFTDDDSNDGSYTINEGDALTFRYRIVIHEGEMTADLINSLYGQFAAQ